MSFLRILLHLQVIACFVFIAGGKKKVVAPGSSGSTCPAAIKGVISGKVPITNYSQPLVSLADQFHNRTNHNNCLRKCDGKPRLCYYKFQAVHYSTMSRACGRCPSVKEDCYLPQCVAADGVPRGITTFNRMIPGPSIQVCEGDIVVVDVENNLLSDSTTVHWHGIRQIGTQYFDGVPYVTQCPIGPGETFRYYFQTVEAGSFFFHSHDGLQKQDGLSGPLIVRENRNRKLNFHFDEDRPEHVFYVQDWLHILFNDKFPGTRGQHNSANLPECYLINGRGIFIGFNKTLNEIAAQVGSKNQPPVSTFDVEKGKTYRFRLISGTCLTCASSVFIQGHRMTIVSGDGGRDVVPTTVDTIYLNSGERFDVLINATHPIGSYWIVVRGARECKGAKQLAILRYKGAPPIPAADSSITAPGPLIFNPQVTYCNDTTRNEICLFQLQSAQPPPKEVTRPKGRMRIPLIFGFHYYSIQELYRSGTYNPYFHAEPDNVLLISLINNNSHVAPPSPLISQYNDIPKDSFCQAQCNSTPFCICTNVIKIPLDTVVDVVIGDSVPFNAVSLTHPFHLHGYNFYVIKQGLYNADPITSLQEIFRGLDRGEINNPTAPMKDTVSVSSGGYAIIRFKAGNPGFWLMHCHFLLHLETGMAVVFQVGEFSDLPPIPQGFPRCGNFLPQLKCP